MDCARHVHDPGASSLPPLASVERPRPVVCRLTRACGSCSGLQISTDDNKGFYFSLFQGILSVQLIPGNLASYYLLNYNDDESDDTAGGTTTTTTEPPNPLENMAVGWSDQNSVLFVALAVCCSLGVLGLGCLRPPDPKMGTAIPVDDRTLRVQIRSTLAHVCTRRLAYLIPLFVFGGIQLVMWASWFPRQMHAKWIGLVMPVFGGAAFVGGFLIGPALDRYGFVFAIALAIVAAVGAFSCTWAGNRKLVAFCEQHAPTEAMPCESYGDYDLFFAAAFFYGVLDVTFHTLSGAICTQSFASSGNTVDAFAAKWAFFGVGAIIGFSLSSPLSVEDGKTSSESQLATELGITGAALLLAIPTLGRFLLHPPEPKSGDATGPPRTEDVIPNPYMDGLLGWTSL